MFTTTAKSASYKTHTLQVLTIPDTRARRDELKRASGVAGYTLNENKE